MTQKEDLQVLLKSAVKKALILGEQGNIRDSSKLFHFIFETCKKFPGILWNDREIQDLGRAFLMLYHLDIYEEEDDSIFIAQLAYVYISRAIEITEKDAEVLYSLLRTQLALMKSCEDCFTYLITELYIPEKNQDIQEYRTTANQLANTMITYIQYNIIMDIELIVPDFNNDAFITDLCDNIETSYPDISEEALFNAKKIQRLMYKTIKNTISSDSDNRKI